MPTIVDGPRSPHFVPLDVQGNAEVSSLAGDGPRAMSLGMTREMADTLSHAPSGACVCWGIPFQIGEIMILSDHPISLEIGPICAHWLVFLHTSDLRPSQPGPGGLIAATRGMGQLAEHAADYVIRYVDGNEARSTILRRHQLAIYEKTFFFFGENCFEAVAHHKPHPVRGAQEQVAPDWGVTQMRVSAADEGLWVNWLWAWENPYPEKAIAGFRFEPAAGTIVISAITAGDVTSLPLRWRPRRKACLVLPEGESFQPDLDRDGLLGQIQLDLGQVISAAPRMIYPNDGWSDTYNNQLPQTSGNEILVEYTAHPDACFHLSGSWGSRLIPVSEVEAGIGDCTWSKSLIRPVASAERLVRLRTVERGSQKPVAVKLHIHGEWGEYLAPQDRHRILNPAWFEDYSADFSHAPGWPPTHHHDCTYINGDTLVKLPLGRVYLEVSKGFEIRPVRQVFDVTPETEEIVIELDRVLPWRERGWVTADTHVHFLSPTTAMLEGAAEGVNVVNLLASQWGELMTNVGDFDGRNTWGLPGTGGGPEGNAEYLVRVGTENRQHVLGHISLLGYRGAIIAPMTTGGPDESAIGDPIDALLTEWARQCRQQDGLVVLPHFPVPRAEAAAAIVSGDIDAVEMPSLFSLYEGISPYSLSDWYRYLNCGYLLPVVGGTDKMSASTAVGMIRTYARIPNDLLFSYEAWKQAVRRGETFVTFGPLIEFLVDGRPMGSHIAMSAQGGRVEVTWQVASVTIPMSRIELVVNGEIRESVAVPSSEGSGHWSVRVDRSSWLALLVRGHYADRPEIITAHSSPVMIQVEGSRLLAAADAVTILDQIEGAMAYLDTVGTRAEDRAYKRMRLVLESAHRSLHNRMHQQGHYHEHTQANVHPEDG